MDFNWNLQRGFQAKFLQLSVKAYEEGGSRYMYNIESDGLPCTNFLKNMSLHN